MQVQIRHFVDQTTKFKTKFWDLIFFNFLKKIIKHFQEGEWSNGFKCLFVKYHTEQNADKKNSL